MCELSPVTFHGDTIFCVTLENQPYTPAKPIVENLGLGWASQSQKLNANKERWGVTIIVIPSESGEQQTLCLPVRKLPAFLASINPKKVKPELRERIELYQAECDDALWNYWMHGRAARSRPLADDMVLPPTDAPITPADQSILQSIVKAKIEAIPADKRGKGLYPQLWSRFNNHFRLGSYKQLPQCRMADAVTYLMGLELPADRKEELPPPLPQDLPADMDDGRKDALRKIRSIMDSMLAARSVVNLFLYPRPVNMNSPHFERLTHNAQHDFYAAALDCLSAAYQALEAGYRLQHAILPSVERS